jgi:hypothetical protein
MKDSIKEYSEFKEKLQKGLELAFRKLLLAKQQSNGFLVLSENGIIKKVKATDLTCP